MKKHLEQEVINFNPKLHQYQFQLLLHPPHHPNNPILHLHPPPPPTHSQHSPNILFTIYQPYSHKKRFKLQTLHYLPPHQAPIKTLTFLIKPHNPYPYLKPQ
ncbi:PCRF domain-containing protein, partial [Staphylococcus aureus]|uniref:PCRF domain-containing protein n=1 Tax=Staphylococcus aureus TaxID=1280 RepID=UPI0037DA090A